MKKINLIDWDELNAKATGLRYEDSFELIVSALNQFISELNEFAEEINQEK